MSELPQLLEEIQKSLDSIIVIDFVPIERRKELDARFNRLTGLFITPDSERFYPWIPVEDVNALVNLTEQHGVPEGFNSVNVICVKHIGVAYEIICYGKVDGAYLEREGELRANDLTNYQDPLTQRLQARLLVINTLQTKLEAYLSNYIPGIFLAKIPKNQDEPRSPAILLYRLDVKNRILSQPYTGVGMPSRSPLSDWINSFAYGLDATGKAKGNDLSFLDWDVDSPISLVKEQFVIGHGRSYFIDKVGPCRKRYIMIGPPEMDINNPGRPGDINLFQVLLHLSKCLMCFHYIRHRFNELEEKVVFSKSINIPIVKYSYWQPWKLKHSLDNLVKTRERMDEWLRSVDVYWGKVHDEIKCLKSLIDWLEPFPKEIAEGAPLFGDKQTVSEVIINDTKMMLDKLERSMIEILEIKSGMERKLLEAVQITSSYVSTNLTWLILLVSFSTLCLGIISVFLGR